MSSAAAGDIALRGCLPVEISHLKGEGVAVAVIDSGISRGHPHVGDVIGGVSFTIDNDGRVRQSNDFQDRSGHGTACAAVIRGWAPQAGILAVKILDDRLSSRTELLIEGIEWARSSGADVINMSLGTYRDDMLGELESSIEAAGEAGIVFVASSQNPDDPPAPARFPCVISVAPDPDELTFHIRRGNKRGADFIAYPYPREIPGITRQSNFFGPSFASAHVSGLACLAKEKARESDHNDVKKFLLDLSGELTR